MQHLGSLAFESQQRRNLGQFNSFKQNMPNNEFFKYNFETL